jgi:hypothetical protein
VFGVDYVDLFSSISGHSIVAGACQAVASCCTGRMNPSSACKWQMYMLVFGLTLCFVFLGLGRQHTYADNLQGMWLMTECHLIQQGTHQITV